MKEEVKEEVKAKVEEKKPAPKKAAPKAAAKKETAEKKIKQKGQGAQKVKDGIKKLDDKFDKIGYKELYDYLTLIAGILGLLVSIIGLIDFLTYGYYGGNDITGLFTAPFSTTFNDSLRDMMLYIIQIWIYINLALFPIIIKKVAMPVIEKWKSFPLHFIKTPEDFRSFNMFLGFWSCLFFWAASPWMRTVHFLCVVLLTVVILADPLSKKLKFMPERQTME